MPELRTQIVLGTEMEVYFLTESDLSNGHDDYDDEDYNYDRARPLHKWVKWLGQFDHRVLVCRSESISRGSDGHTYQVRSMLQDIRFGPPQFYLVDLDGQQSVREWSLMPYNRRGDARRVRPACVDPSGLWRPPYDYMVLDGLLDSVVDKTSD